MTTLWEITGSGWVGHRHDGTVADGAGLILAPGRTDGVFEATLPIGPAFDRLVPSLNAVPLPPDSTIRVRLRALVGDAWTPWAPLGVYGTAGGLPRSEVGPDPTVIEVQTDTVCLPRAATQAGVRLELTRAAGSAPPVVRRFALVAWLRGGADPAVTPPSGRACELDVPERSQAVEDPAIASRICSPTSLSMVLARWGHELPTAEVARGVYDHAANIYGNWSFNVAFAASLDLEATVARFASFAPLEDELAAGRPVVISHRYGAGEVAGAAVSKTDGHLIVVRGVTAEGDLVVNDPAADPRDGEAIRRVYRRADLARSWLRNAGGVCYLVRE